MSGASNGSVQAQPLTFQVLPQDPTPLVSVSPISIPRKRHVISLDDDDDDTAAKSARRPALELDDSICGASSKPHISQPCKQQHDNFEKVLKDQLAALERALAAAHSEECAAIHRDSTRFSGTSWLSTEATRDRSPPNDKTLAEREALTSPLKLDVDPSKNGAVMLTDGTTGPKEQAEMILLANQRRHDLQGEDGEHDEDGLCPNSVSFTTTYSVYSQDSTILQLKGLWKEPDSKLQLTTPSHRQLDRAVSGMLKRTVTTQLLVSGMPDEYEDVRRSKTCSSRFITHPTSMKRFFWDVLGVFIMLYDTIIIPMQVFELPASILTFSMGKVSLGYWTLDIVLSFMVGYYSRGVLEMRPSHIAVHYAVTWLPFDIIIAGLDWSVQIATGGDAESVGAKSKQVTRIGRALRTLRTLRSLRLLRLIKMRHLLSEIQERFSSQYVHIILRMVKLIVAIALLNHFIACGWWAIGKSGDPRSWIIAGEMEGQPVGYCYTTSLHWSLTQFTPASMEVVPTNTAERTYAVCTLLFAMVIFSSFVSSITATMTILRELSGKQGKTKQFKVLRLYLKDNNISKKLQIRIQKYLQHMVLRAKSHVPEKDVELLTMLSTSLRMELRYTIVFPVFGDHVFFRRFELASIQAARQLCTKAAMEVPMSVGDTLFSTGEAAHAMYFVVSGKCLYQQGQRGGLRSNADNNTICEVGWFLAEMSLWCNWVHRGELLANVQGRCMLVKEEPFSMVVAAHQGVIGSARRYAAALLTELEKEKTPLSDLPPDDIDFEMIVNDCFPLPDLNKSQSKKQAERAEDYDLDWDLFQARLQGAERSMF